MLGIIDLTALRPAKAGIASQRDALHQSEKLAALGSLLACVARELNTPLSVALGYSAMLRDQAPDDATHDRATRIHAAAEHCARIVRTFPPSPAAARRAGARRTSTASSRRRCIQP